MNRARKPLIAGNWKMFHGDRSGAILAAECAKIARAKARRTAVDRNAVLRNSAFSVDREPIWLHGRSQLRSSDENDDRRIAYRAVKSRVE